MRAAGSNAASREDLLERVAGGHVPAFAVLHRPETVGTTAVEVLVCETLEVASLADIPVPEDLRPTGQARHDVLAILPYHQIAERGFACVDDGTPLLALPVTEQRTVPLATALAALPDEPIALSGGHFDIDDDGYAGIVRSVLADAIGEGDGANFVIKRSFVADIGNYGPRTALALFRRLLQQETGAYWTFIVHTGERTLVGASPERHISLHRSVAVMNPISGTYRYPACGPSLDEIMDFLADRKEAEELYMVLDEELKMMARVCEGGGRVVGPYLKEMARLAHTEYFIEGRSTRDPREILRETMFAPTVTGSPLESASRVIARYEPAGRGYYSGALATIGRDELGRRTMDSAILIRTADIDRSGKLTLGVGATLVRHSDPTSEVEETRAKAAGMLAALGSGGGSRFAEHPSVREALEQRNVPIADFWLSGAGRSGPDPALAGRGVLVIDAEDTFTAMLDQQLRSLGLAVTVRRFDESYTLVGDDLVVLGPGPGDPREDAHPKIAHLRQAVRSLLVEQRPFLAVCLSHQVLARELGLEVVRRTVPNQGIQREVEVFGRRERVGFYNTFAARCDTGSFHHDVAGPIEVSRDPATGEVHALRGRNVASFQFHAESVLSLDGVRILGTALRGLLDGSTYRELPRAS
ncbi:chorismate-binding protein [Haloechinothrix sp. LS1_15]|uniref:anthranilate synthase family protein n=1 Tax=Haloechinothrix sp. LS1_15 TaxID=2652248 RepID=UPI00294439BB|nr:chorismate-binding protein [Haloechinothrix sp. LS1_15]MDV6011632.1 phenazine-specific anthranilate synthase component I [Haloechinothrix sp. LS1_15]